MRQPSLLAGLLGLGYVGLAALPAFAGERPEFAELVAAGQLPPLEERLPAEPEVIDFGDVGTYGGQWRFGMVTVNDDGTLRQHIGTNGLVRWHHNRQELIPNVAESWEVNEDGSVYTFHLRDGMRWSDGELLTTEDIAFAINEVMLNEEYGSLSQRFKVGDDPMSLEIVDDLTFRLLFPGPNGEFLGQLAREEGAQIVAYPAHYCSQFHPDYNADLDALVEAEGAPDWQTLFDQKCGIEETSRWLNPERAVLEPWVQITPLDAGTTVIAFGPNPYFWQVDAAGNQLPYIGDLEARVFQEPAAMVLAAVGGQLDFQFRGIDASSNRPVLADGRESGEYELYEIVGVGGNYAWILPNLNHPDPVINELINQKDFRIALSIGMDRTDVINTALLGVGTPWQQGPWEDDPLHHAQFATQYLEYDADRANTLLDGLGLTERNAEGIRLLSDGRPARFQVDIRNDEPHLIDVMEIVREYWMNIGIAVDLNVIDESLHELRSAEGIHDFTTDTGNTTLSPGQLPSALLPIDESSRYATLWVEWYTSEGAAGIEPPEHVKQRYQIWEAINANVDPQRRIDLFLELQQIAADQFEHIGITKNPSNFGIVKTGLRNVLPGMVATSQWPSPANVFMPQAWYWAE